MLAGMDGVGRAPDGTLYYFVQPGSMAARVLAAPGHTIALPPGSDPVTVAGAMNPAMAAWLAMACTRMQVDELRLQQTELHAPDNGVISAPSRRSRAR